jgi:hypothetical protein
MTARGDSDDSGAAAAACVVDSGGGRKVRFCGRADRNAAVATATQYIPRLVALPISITCGQQASKLHPVQPRWHMHCTSGSESDVIIFLLSHWYDEIRL